MNVNATAEDLSSRTIPELVALQVAILDEMKDTTTVRAKLYKSKTVGIKRILNILKAARKDPRFGGESQDKRRGTNIPPSGKILQSCLIGTKQAALVDALARPEGATMAELVGVLQAHNPKGIYNDKRVRTAFGWDLKSRGYGVRSQLVGKEERFFLVVPKGSEVVPHRGRKCPIKDKVLREDAREQGH